MEYRAAIAAGRAATALLAVAALAIAPAPAGARDTAVLGSVTISPASGAVDSRPMLGTAAASAPCPAGYGSNALLRVGPPGGPYSNIVKPATAGGYDRQPVALSSDRSMTAALGRAPADGPYRVVVECSGAGIGRHPGRFETAIVVSGSTWRLSGGDDGGSSTVWWLLAVVALAMAGAVALLVRLRRPGGATAGPVRPRRPTAAPKPSASAGSRAGGS